MALTITIPGAVSTTTGSTAPAVLTVGVGSPGVGVPSGGSTGQYLVKASATSYDTAWLTLPANYITSVTAPLAVTAGNLAVDLSAYLTTATAASTYQTIAGMSSYLTSATAASTYQTIAGMSSYLTSATAASTYAVIAAGQPTSGTVGQVLTKASGTNYDSYWATPVIGDKYYTTSTTSLAIGTGTKSLTVGTGLSYTTQQTIIVAYDSANHMHATVTSYNSSTGAMVISVSQKSGSGTYSSWTVNVGAVVSGSWGSITGTLSDQTDLQTALDAKLAVTTAASTYAPIASPGFTGSPSMPTGTIGVTQTAGNSTTALATTAFVTTANNMKANLASPTFTGTPTLPTGTIATTQSPGNNTTAVATTAFVTAAVPAFATNAQARTGTSTTTVLSPFLSSLQAANPSIYAWPSLNSVTSGTGASNGLRSAYGYLQQSPNASTAGYAVLYSNVQMSWRNGAPPESISFTKPVFISGKISKFSGAGGDANTTFRAYVGGTDTGGSPNGGDPVLESVGIKLTGGSGQNIKLMVHNGTTQTLVSSTTTIAEAVVYEWLVYLDGSGNASLYINGVVEATTTAGPTVGVSTCYAVQALSQTVSTVTRLWMENRNIRVQVGN